MATRKLHPEGLLGKKLGMTQVFTPEGETVPVTIIQLGPCFILGVKQESSDGYKAVQLGFEPRKNQRVNKPLMGHFGKAGGGAFYHVREVRCDIDALGWTTPGRELKAAEVFADGDMVDVSGITIGRGFAGVVRRYRIGGQPASRGTHEFERHVGSIGCRKFPGRVFKNQRMPGHMGAVHRTVQNLKIMAVKGDDNIVLVRGAIPGPRGAVVEVRKAMKSYKGKERAAA